MHCFIYYYRCYCASFCTPVIMEDCCPKISAANYHPPQVHTTARCVQTANRLVTSSKRNQNLEIKLRSRDWRHHCFSCISNHAVDPTQQTRKLISLLTSVHVKQSSVPDAPEQTFRIQSLASSGTANRGGSALSCLPAPSHQEAALPQTHTQHLVLSSAAFRFPA